ncbi:uncharacterized protein BKCO1_37000204 [Diplodia corticola]|uniref:Uncharacterized protein n=1 Tax=Diplodia corticola TaxID=236234 RepID=A0A1J9QX83_9PEZI|nr:uncharacterized protein BKCO1_37000204 [Diplodia corticola]OJD32594.1 hypothetical protein BKCO1_37000204 [Diplodia corticola]
MAALQAIGRYSGVPQEEPPLSQNPPNKRYSPSALRTVSLLGFVILTAAIIGVLQWIAAPGNRDNIGNVRRRNDVPTITHFPRATPGAATASTASGPSTVMIISSATESPHQDDGTSTTSEGAFIPITPSTTVVVGTTISDAFVPIDPNTVETESTATTAFVPMKPGTAADPTEGFSTDPDAFIPLGDATGTADTPITTPTAGTFVITTSIPGGTSPAAFTITGTIDPSQPLLITATGSSIPGGTLVITRTGPLVAGPTTPAQGSGGGSSGSSGSSTNTTSPSSTPPSDAFAAYGARFNISHYLLGAYAPTLFAVIYGILWSTILAGMAEMAPWFQLTRPGGATAKESLLLSYQNASLWGLFVGSIKHKDGFVLAGSVVSALVTATIALASGVFYIGVSGTCRETGRGADCVRYLAVDRRLAWAESGMLAVVLACVVGVWLSARRKDGGLYAEAMSVAGVATLMGNPGVVAKMREALERERQGGGWGSNDTRFGVGQSYDKAAGWTYGFTVVDDGQKRDPPAKIFDDGDNNDDSTPVLPLLLRPYMLALFLLLLLALLAILLYYWFNGTSSFLEDFLDSQTFGPKLMMSIFGLIIRTWWSEIARVQEIGDEFQVPHQRHLDLLALSQVRGQLGHKVQDVGAGIARHGGPDSEGLLARLVGVLGVGSVFGGEGFLPELPVHASQLGIEVVQLMFGGLVENAVGVVEDGFEVGDVGRVGDEGEDADALAAGVAVPLAVLGDEVLAFVVDHDEVTRAHYGRVAGGLAMWVAGQKEAEGGGWRLTVSYQLRVFGGPGV